MAVFVVVAMTVLVTMDNFWELGEQKQTSLSQHKTHSFVTCSQAMPQNVLASHENKFIVFPLTPSQCINTALVTWPDHVQYSWGFVAKEASKNSKEHDACLAVLTRSTSAMYMKSPAAMDKIQQLALSL